MARQAKNDPAIEQMERSLNFLLREFARWKGKPCANFSEHMRRELALREIRLRCGQIDRDLDRYVNG